MPNTKYQIPNTKYQMPNAKCPETCEFVTQVLLLTSNLLGLIVLFFGADRYIALDVL